jgi:hypothetical protein
MSNDYFCPINLLYTFQKKDGFRVAENDSVKRFLRKMILEAGAEH